MGAVGRYDSDGSKKQEVPTTLEYVERPFKPYTKCCEYDFFRICLLAGPEHHYHDVLVEPFCRYIAIYAAYTNPAYQVIYYHTTLLLRTYTK